jgi:hypothetical protein
MGLPEGPAVLPRIGAMDGLVQDIGKSTGNLRKNDHFCHIEQVQRHTRLI